MPEEPQRQQPEQRDIYDRATRIAIIILAAYVLFKVFIIIF